MVEEAQVLVERDALVTLGNEPLPDVAHEDAGAATLACDAREGVVDRRRHPFEEAGAPHEKGSTSEVTGGAHDPVVVDADVLDHERLAADDDAFHGHARLAVGVRQRLSRRRTGEQLVDVAGDRPVFAGLHFLPALRVRVGTAIFPCCRR